MYYYYYYYFYYTASHVNFFYLNTLFHQYSIVWDNVWTTTLCV